MFYGKLSSTLCKEKMFAICLCIYWWGRQTIIGINDVLFTNAYVHHTASISKEREWIEQSHPMECKFAEIGGLSCNLKYLAAHRIRRWHIHCRSHGDKRKWHRCISWLYSIYIAYAKHIGVVRLCFVLLGFYFAVLLNSYDSSIVFQLRWFAASAALCQWNNTGGYGKGNIDWCPGWNYLSIPKLQWCNRWSLGIEK